MKTIKRKIRRALLPALLCALAGAAAAATVAYIQIQAGVSLTLKVGGTKWLSVLGYSADGTEISAPSSVTWTSDNLSVARVIRSYDSAGAAQDQLTVFAPGTALITATAVNASGDQLTDTLTVNVVESMSYMDIGTEAWERLEAFNSSLAAWDMGLDFVDANPARVSAASFQRTFSGAWSTSPAQVTDLNASDLNFSTRGNPPSGSWTSARPGVAVTLSGSTRGQLLPLKYVWSYSWRELSRILGTTVTSNPGAERLFRSLRLDFYGVSGSTGSSAHYTVLGPGGVSAVASGGAAIPPLTLRDTGTGLSIELVVYLANVQGSTGPQLIDGLLVVPDGAADGSISGTMWMLEGVSESGGTGGGHGGCGAFSAGALGLLLLPGLLLLGTTRRKGK